MQPLKKLTSKLFYKKWPYKIECICSGAYMIKRQGIIETANFCLSNKTDLTGWGRNKIDRQKLFDFMNAVSPYVLRKDLQIRCEGSHFNIYCSDRALYEKICISLKNFISVVHEPENEQELIYMVDNKAKKVLCNHIPFNKFRYKVYIKTGTPLTAREKFHSWIKKYQTAKIPGHVEKWLLSGNVWGTMPFVYVENTATLSMIGLFLGNYVLRIEEFITRSSINIPISQEEPCQV